MDRAKAQLIISYLLWWTHYYAIQLSIQMQRNIPSYLLWSLPSSYLQESTS